MKKIILTIPIGLWCLTFNLNAQNKTDKPTLANSSTSTKVDNKNINEDEKSQLQTASKTSTKVLEKKESNSKNNNTSNSPKIETMSKKEEK